MNPTVPPSTGLSVVYTPTQADVHHLARLQTRRLRLMFLVIGSLMSVAFLLNMSDGDPAPFLAGLLTGLIGLTLLLSAVTLPRGVARRLPSSVREQRTYEVDEVGIRMRGSTWEVAYTWAAFGTARLTKDLVLLNGEHGETVLALPRSAFTSQDEAQLMAMLADRSLLS